MNAIECRPAIPAGGPSLFFLPSWKKIQFLLPPPLLGTLCKTVIAVLLLAGWRRVERPVCGLPPIFSLETD